MTSTMDSKTSNKSSFTALRWCFNTFMYQVIFVIGVFILWNVCYFTKGDLFWHALLCTLAYMPLMAEAILLYSEDTAWASNVSRRHKMWIHGIVLVICSIFALAGTLLLTVSRSEAGRGHFGSPHSLWGLVSIVFCFIGVLGGLAIGNYKLFKLIPLNWLKICHVLCSGLGYILGMVSLYFAYDYMKGWATPEQLSALQITTIIVIVYTLINPLISVCTKIAVLFK